MRLSTPALCIASTMPTASLRVCNSWKKRVNVCVLGVMESHAASAESSGESTPKTVALCMLASVRNGYF